MAVVAGLRTIVGKLKLPQEMYVVLDWSEIGHKPAVLVCIFAEDLSDLGHVGVLKASQRVSNCYSHDSWKELRGF